MNDQTPAQPRPKDGILQIAPYKGGAASLAGQEQVVKLSSNESPWGPPPAAMRAVKAVAEGLHMYPSGDHAGLRHALAAQHGLDADRIICGNGSGEILGLIAQAYCSAGDQVIYTTHGFSMYPIYVHMVGADPVVVPEKNRVVDVDAILAAVTPATRLVYVTNPGNPTGTAISKAEVLRLADGLPADVLLVLDGAYAEFAGDDDGAMALAQTRANVVASRTFSKAYGLGGMRIGWAYGPAHIIDALMRIRGPFNLSVPALAAAEAAVLEPEFIEQTTARTVALRDQMIADLRACGVDVDPAHANFILARFADRNEAHAVDNALKAVGLIVRRVDGYGFPEGLRITIGDDAACAQVTAVIRKFKEAQQ